MKLKMNYMETEKSQIWILNNMLLNNQWVKEEIKLKKIPRQNGNTTESYGM